VSKYAPAPREGKLDGEGPADENSGSNEICVRRRVAVANMGNSSGNFGINLSLDATLLRAVGCWRSLASRGLGMMSFIAPSGVAGVLDLKSLSKLDVYGARLFFQLPLEVRKELFTAARDSGIFNSVLSWLLSNESGRCALLNTHKSLLKGCTDRLAYILRESSTCDPVFAGVLASRVASSFSVNISSEAAFRILIAARDVLNNGNFGTLDITFEGLIRRLSGDYAVKFACNLVNRDGANSELVLSLVKNGTLELTGDISSPMAFKILTAWNGGVDVESFENNECPLRTLVNRLKGADAVNFTLWLLKNDNSGTVLAFRLINDGTLKLPANLTSPCALSILTLDDYIINDAVIEHARRGFSRLIPYLNYSDAVDFVCMIIKNSGRNIDAGIRFANDVILKSRLNLKSKEALRILTVRPGMVLSDNVDIINGLIMKLSGSDAINFACRLIRDNDLHQELITSLIEDGTLKLPEVLDPEAVLDIMYASRHTVCDYKIEELEGDILDSSVASSDCDCIYDDVENDTEYEFALELESGGKLTFKVDEDSSDMCDDIEKIYDEIKVICNEIVNFNRGNYAELRKSLLCAATTIAEHCFDENFKIDLLKVKVVCVAMSEAEMDESFSNFSYFKHMISQTCDVLGNLCDPDCAMLWDHAFEGFDVERINAGKNGMEILGTMSLILGKRIHPLVAILVSLFLPELQISMPLCELHSYLNGTLHNHPWLVAKMCVDVLTKGTFETPAGHIIDQPPTNLSTGKISIELSNSGHRRSDVFRLMNSVRVADADVQLKMWQAEEISCTENGDGEKYTLAMPVLSVVDAIFIGIFKKCVSLDKGISSSIESVYFGRSFIGNGKVITPGGNVDAAIDELVKLARFHKMNGEIYMHTITHEKIFGDISHAENLYTEALCSLDPDKMSPSDITFIGERNWGDIKGNPVYMAVMKNSETSQLKLCSATATFSEEFLIMPINVEYFICEKVDDEL
jgi:hypothetical protein